MNKFQIETRIKKIEEELEILKARLDGPVWESQSTGTIVLIAGMSDDHLVRALRCCIRMDKRYDWTPARMKSFAEMIREAARRRISATKWIED